MTLHRTSEQMRRFYGGRPSRQYPKPAPIVLPPDLLPCIDDPEKLLVMADLVEERGDSPLAVQLRETAAIWQGGKYLRLADVPPKGMAVWVRWRGGLDLPWRTLWVSGIRGGIVYVCTNWRETPNGKMPRRNTVARAWWDCAPYTDDPSNHGMPPPRIKNDFAANVRLARALAYNPRET